MRQNEITIGSSYRVRIGDRLATVTVLRRKAGSGRARFVCETHDTRREIAATAARLRPLVEPRPATAPAAAVEPSPTPAAWDGHPGDAWLPLVPVGSLLPTRGRGQVLRLSAANHAFVRRLVDREHVAHGMRRISRVVREAIGQRYRWLSIPRDLRRGILFTAACIHHGNREQYSAVMGHAPIPSEELVTAAMGGDHQARAAVLAG